MPRKSIVCLAALTVLAALTAGGARAEDPADVYAKRMFAGQLAAKGTSYACFARRYDAGHLAQHPQQKVESMRLLVSAKTVVEDPALNYDFALGVKFRGQAENFSNSGDCGHPAVDSAGELRLGCGVDCDGGGLSIALVNADKSVIVRTERMALWGSKDAADVGGADDRVFRLDRVQLDECKPLMPEDDQDGDESATM